MLPHPFDVPEGFLATELAHMLLGAMDWKMLIEPALCSKHFLAVATGELFGSRIMRLLMYLEA